MSREQLCGVILLPPFKFRINRTLAEDVFKYDIRPFAVTSSYFIIFYALNTVLNFQVDWFNTFLYIIGLLCFSTLA